MWNQNQEHARRLYAKSFKAGEAPDIEYLSIGDCLDNNLINTRIFFVLDLSLHTINKIIQHPVQTIRNQIIFTNLTIE